MDTGDVNFSRPHRPEFKTAGLIATLLFFMCADETGCLPSGDQHDFYSAVLFASLLGFVGSDRFVVAKTTGR